MVNRDYTPTDNEEQILDIFKEGYGEDIPWGRVNPLYLRKRTDLNKQQVNYALSQLTAAGWIKKLTEGLYEFVTDPRTEPRLNHE
ncbi:MarR family transcriptional regulator [Haloplanus rallus]|uniref:MarR family transcriptional regulator n=1 Tax=Haloplanus rallus TaxID=1816183 RepID=A0A6B9FDJ1_9EURY|nr:MarR family transcriptional regulator [Haloplanus rallus]